MRQRANSLEKLEADLRAIGQTADLAALEALRVSALGKSGSVTGLLKTLGKLPPEDAQKFRPGGQRR